MRLRVALDVSIGLHEGQDVAGFCMSDWSRKAANKLHERAEQKNSENAALTEKRRLMEEQGPGLWQQLCMQVKKLCDELNADYGEDIATVIFCSWSECRVTARWEHERTERQLYYFNFSRCPEMVLRPPCCSNGGAAFSRCRRRSYRFSRLPYTLHSRINRYTDARRPITGIAQSNGCRAFCTFPAAVVRAVIRSQGGGHVQQTR
jgi:hypothetical protein